jgi:hypothetical protein
VDVDVLDQILIIHSVSIKYLKKMGIEWGSASAIMDFKDVLCNIFIEFSIPLNLVRLNKKCVEIKPIVQSGQAKICLIHILLTLCSRATTKVVFSVTRFDPRSPLSSFSHAPFCE